MPNDIILRENLFDSIIDKTLDFLDKDLQFKKIKSNEFHNLPLPYFFENAIEPAGIEKLSALGEVFSADDYHGFFTYAQLSDLHTTFDSTVLIETKEKNEESGNYQIIRGRVVDAKEVRGKVAFLRPIIVEFSRAYIYSDRYESLRFFLTPIDGKWMALTSPGEYGQTRKIYKEFSMDAHNSLQMLIGTQFSAELIWWIEIKRQDRAFSIRLPIHPEAPQYLFKLRDVPKDKQRRPMLRNWISEHTRQLKNGIVTDIRSHLRGNIEFSFAGYDCIIKPSISDKLKNKEEIIKNIISTKTNCEILNLEKYLN